jgi:prepilin-type N-terminal cleavage/methylation domain-containing protein/prepilin-type processing-associated H-X9-DG protein
METICAWQRTIQVYVGITVKTAGVKSRRTGLSLIELLVVIAIIAILAALILPALSGSERAPGAMCMSHQKQLDLGFILYQNDFEKYPMQTSVKDGGTSEFIYTGHVFPHFEKLHKYIQSRQLYDLMVCPSDKNRKAATNSEAFNDMNISYFLNVDCATNSPTQAILMGDRNLTIDGSTALTGTLLVTTNINLRWTEELHRKGGVLAFADGHVEWCKSENLNNPIRQQPAATNRFAIP